MSPVFWLATGSVLSAALFGLRFGSEVWLGMLGPLMVVSAIVAYTPKNTSFAAKAATISDVSSSGRDG